MLCNFVHPAPKHQICFVDNNRLQVIVGLVPEMLIACSRTNFHCAVLSNQVTVAWWNSLAAFVKVCVEVFA